MAEVTRRLSTQEWDELIENYHISGLTAAQWCESHSFKVSQLRWQMIKRFNGYLFTPIPLSLDHHRLL
ncbi:hypothetical protein [Alkalihalobacillus sp. BA299]|uniref:IS66 family insertion sequence element accessory protein TnpA n=1 Tax=Alkalihalobacillus sp. BA299 TaxID=2815938 RepID=UPI001ADBE116|nr:hypothetical protein [Alkalihalobacillus sp. BA299]